VAGALTPVPASRKLRVLHIVQNLNYGGMERLVFEVLRRTDRAAFESHVLTLVYRGRFGEGLSAHATLHEAAPMSKASLLWPASLAGQIRSIAPDVVHTHSGVWYKASLAAKLAGVPRVVHTEHGRAVPDPWTARTLDGLASRRTDAVIAVSESVAARLRADVVHDSRRVVIIANGVDTDLFIPGPDNGRLRAELGIAAGTPVIGSIGRLEPVKGYEVSVEALALLRRGPIGAAAPVLVLAGDGSQRRDLEERAARLGVTDGIRFLGWRDDTRDLLSAFALFTMSSHSEGTSVSLLEAMSAGLCPVVTDVGGNAAVLGPALAHRLVPPGDAAALAEAWRDTLLDQSRRESDARAARARVLATFTLERMVRDYGRVHRGELPGPPAVPS
jgi:glycosyltransferase involved in cell wall biosynthesis